MGRLYLTDAGNNVYLSLVGEIWHTLPWRSKVLIMIGDRPGELSRVKGYQISMEDDIYALIDQELIEEGLVEEG